MIQIIDSNYNTIHPQHGLTADDITLVPARGTVPSREEVKRNSVNQNLLMNAPMFAAFSEEMIEIAYENSDFLCVPRIELLPESTIEALHAFFEIDSPELSWWRENRLFLAIGKNSEKVYLRITNNKIANVIIDIAHGYSELGLELIQKYSKTTNHIMSGSIATPEAALSCAQAGANLLRVGIGNGSACTTRLSTGIGIPQLTAIMAISKKISPIPKVQIVADGNIEKSADFVKYLAAGANYCMSGKQYAKIKESGNWDPNGEKIYYGHASKLYPGKLDKRYIEGDTYRVKCTSTYDELVTKYHDGLASACSYLGHHNYKHITLRKNYAMLVTSSGLSENGVRR